VLCPVLVDAAGMEGTGSDSFTVRDVFVPEHRVLPVRKKMNGSDQRWQEGERVYYMAVSSMVGISTAGPVIGMAQGALEHVLEMLAGGKPITGSLYTDAVRSPSAQLAVAPAGDVTPELTPDSGPPREGCARFLPEWLRRP